MEKEAKYLTGSGVEIFSYKNPSASSFYISLFLRAGSMYERVEDSGITHFLEHTLVRNVNALMDGELYPLLDRYGIEFNASTYSEMVQFYVYGAKAHFDIGAKIISMLLSPIVLTPEEIRTECSRIKAEIRENDERTSLSTFTNGIVNAGTSLAGSITGTLASVSKITRRRLEDYRREVFTRENVFFYVTGAFSDGDIRQLGDLVDAVALPSGAARTNIAPMSQNFFRREGRVYIKTPISLW